MALDPGARAQHELRLALQVEGRRVEGLVEVEALGRNPGDVYEKHGRGRKPTNSTDLPGSVKAAGPRRAASSSHRTAAAWASSGVSNQATSSGLVPEPGHLPLREAHRFGHDRALGLVRAELAPHHLHGLPVADRAERPRHDAAAPGEHGLDLRHEPALEHLPGAGHDRLAQARPVRRQADHERAEALERPAALAVVRA